MILWRNMQARDKMQRWAYLDYLWEQVRIQMSGVLCGWTGGNGDDPSDPYSHGSYAFMDIKARKRLIADLDEVIAYINELKETTKEYDKKGNE